MKKYFLFLLLLLIPATETSARPTFTVGSNYYLTVFAYPHDILKWPNSGVFFFFNPQTIPWQGDVTDIHNRPSESYINNYQEVEFAPPSGYQGNPSDIRSWMKVSGYAYKMNSTIGGLYNTNYGKLYLEIDKTSLDMELSAEGVGRANEDIDTTTEYYMVPFKGETNTARNNYGFEVIYANYLFNNPFGFKVRYVQKYSDVPDGYIEFTREGQTYSLPHLTWGWATSGCNHIFGYSHINTDAFFQNSYSVFEGRQLDLQVSYEYNGNYRSGIRYRSTREDGENYQWIYNDGSEFEGKYYIDQYWKDRRSGDLIRGYSAVKLLKIGSLDAGILFFLQHASYSAYEVNKRTESDPSSEESEKEYTVETNPFLNYNFKGGYLDFGLLLELSRTGMQNTRTRWNSVSQSDQKDVLWTTSPYFGWSPSWENFSKGSNLFLATGFEASSSIGIYRRLALLLRLEILRKYSFIKKAYGESKIPEGGDSYQFYQTHQRSNHKNETWMTGSFGLSYGWGPVQAFWTLQLPLAYLIEQKTKLSDSNSLLFEHSKKNMWQVQQPTTFQMLFVYAFTR